MPLFICVAFMQRLQRVPEPSTRDASNKVLVFPYWTSTILHRGLRDFDLLCTGLLLTRNDLRTVGPCSSVPWTKYQGKLSVYGADAEGRFGDMVRD